MKYYQKPENRTGEFDEHCGVLRQIEHTISALKQLHAALLNDNIPLATVESANQSVYDNIGTLGQFVFILDRRIQKQRYEDDPMWSFSATHPILGRQFGPITSPTKKSKVKIG